MEASARALDVIAVGLIALVSSVLTSRAAQEQEKFSFEENYTKRNTGYRCGTA